MANVPPHDAPPRDAELRSLGAHAIWSVHTGPLPIGGGLQCVWVFTDLYALSLNRRTRFADWIGYRVTAASQSGRNSINRNWLHVAKELTIEAQDYEHSGYSMGHLCPLASVRADADAWEANWTGAVAPQRQPLNAGPWLDFERHCRTQARLHEKVYVAAGTLYEHEMPPLANSDESHVVPSHFWARLFVPATEQVSHWIMPQDADRSDPHDHYQVTAAEFVRRSDMVFPEWTA